MTATLKLISALVTAGLAAGAVIIGGGVPLSPGKISAATQRAADNTVAAERNSGLAAERTEALAVIATNVRAQVQTSHRLLETQLRIEEASSESARSATELERGIVAIKRTLDDLERRLRRLSESSEKSGRVSEASADAAGRLDEALDALAAAFDQVIEESRELNRKAHGYDELIGRTP